MQPIDVNVDLDQALTVDIQLAAPISVPITLAPDVIIDVDVVAAGPAGEPGVGVPIGGTPGQVLAKISGVDYNTEWVDQAAGGDLVNSVNGQTGTVVVTKTDVGLSNVDNTSDANKPISTLTQTALNTKEPTITAGTTAQYYRGDKTFQTLNQDVVPDGTTNKVYSAADKTRLANTSGTNTGDQTTVTGNAGTATTLQTARTIGIQTGDVTSAGSTFNGSANNTNATVLATVNSNVGTFGSATQVPVYTVNAKGLTTASANTSIQIAESQVTNLVADLASKEVPLTFSTGLTRSTNTVTVNTSQNISTLSNLTSNGLIKTSGGTGALSIATAGTDYQAPLSLTTTGTSGAATLIGATLNIPNYAGGGGSVGITRSVVVTSGNITAGSTALVDYVYLIAGAHTVTLPTAVGNTNRYTLKNNHTSSVALAFTGAETADGGGITLAPFSSVDLISTNANWSII